MGCRYLESIRFMKEHKKQVSIGTILRITLSFRTKRGFKIYERYFIYWVLGSDLCTQGLFLT